MTSRTPRFFAVALAMVTLSACSATAGTTGESSGPGGSIELAISETCTVGSDSDCVSVTGDSVVLPSEFERADVKDSRVADTTAVEVTFSSAGAEVFRSLTAEAAGAGDSARLVIKIGGELRAAVMVMQELDGDQVQIALSPDDNAEEIIAHPGGLTGTTPLSTLAWYAAEPAASFVEECP